MSLTLAANATRADDASTFAHVTRYLTARDLGARLKVVPIDEKIASTNPKNVVAIRVEPRVKYQEIVGFGGAFTDSAGYVLNKMPKDKQEEILRAYFDQDKGLGYTLCRTHINSCDFSTENYAYDETPGDTELKHFSIERDNRSLIPMIKRAMEMSHNGFKLFASPWSPPAWMKTNGEMNNGGKLKPEYRQVWADYFVRYIAEYKKIGIPIWGVTIQNEPAATQVWDSCEFTAEEEGAFVRDNLGPAFDEAGVDAKIIVWDHNRGIMYERARPILDDPAAAKYVWGVGFHWYVSDAFENVQRVHDAWPDKHVLLTEACQEGGPHLNEWALGERYGRAIMEDLNHWSVGWVDWNILLDQTGGPNHVGNLCSAPIIAHTDTGELTYQASYYYMGQFAKFIRPGAVRVLAAPTDDGLDSTAFVNTDGSTVVVVMNRTEAPVRFQVQLGDKAVTTDAAGAVDPNAGDQAVKLIALALLVSFTAMADDLPIGAPKNYPGKPELGVPLAIPGTIPAMDYDVSPYGANNITFHYDGESKKTEFRTGDDSIGLAAFGDDHISTTGVPEKSGQVYVGWTQPGEWLKYTVKVAEAGTYVIGGKVAAGSTGATLTFSFGPDLTTGEITIPTTAGFQPGKEVYHVWETIDHLAEIKLPAGTYLMKVEIGKVAGLNLETFTFTKKP